MKLTRSIASRHFPRMVFRNGKRMLWNPVKRQALHFRPEERVRLQVLDFLLLQSDLPSARIAVESSIPSRFSRGRTDLLCYDATYQPYLLIECKAEYVKMGPKTATQSATYNRFVKAPYIMLTNGIQDALFDVTSSLKALDYPDYPSGLCRNAHFSSKDPEYWQDRGFIPHNFTASAASSLSVSLARLFHDSSESRSFLALSFPADQMPMDHYYMLLPAPHHPDTLLAVTLFVHNPDQAVLCAVANRNKQNLSCLRIFVNTNGHFDSPQLFLAKNGDIATPEISKLEHLWLDTHGHDTRPDPGHFISEVSESLEQLLLND